MVLPAYPTTADSDFVLDGGRPDLSDNQTAEIEPDDTRAITATHAAVAESPSRPRLRILVADDESRIRLALRALLEVEGYEVDEAADGNEALDLIIRRAPEIMILDLAMPNLDGLRTLGELECVHQQLKPRVIVLTAWASTPAAMKVIGLGARALLEKPVAYESLLWEIQKILAEQP